MSSQNETLSTPPFDDTVGWSSRWYRGSKYPDESGRGFYSSAGWTIEEDARGYLRVRRVQPPLINTHDNAHGYTTAIPVSASTRSKAAPALECKRSDTISETISKNSKLVKGGSSDLRRSIRNRRCTAKALESQEQQVARTRPLITKTPYPEINLKGVEGPVAHPKPSRAVRNNRASIPVEEPMSSQPFPRRWLLPIDAPTYSITAVVRAPQTTDAIRLRLALKHWIPDFMAQILAPEDRQTHVAYWTPRHDFFVTTWNNHVEETRQQWWNNVGRFAAFGVDPIARDSDGRRKWTTAGHWDAERQGDALYHGVGAYIWRAADWPPKGYWYRPEGSEYWGPGLLEGDMPAGSVRLDWRNVKINNPYAKSPRHIGRRF